MSVFNKVSDFVTLKRFEVALARMEKLQADMDYLAMMSDVELESEEVSEDE